MNSLLMLVSRCSGLTCLRHAFASGALSVKALGRCSFAVANGIRCAIQRSCPIYWAMRCFLGPALVEHVNILADGEDVLYSSVVSRLLITWVGKTDLQASSGDANAGLGPIGQAVKARKFDEVILISNYDKKQSTAYRKWLMAQTAKPATLYLESLSSPTDFGEIYGAVVRNVEEILVRHGQGVDLTFHLSPGTPAMQAVWIILAKTRFRAELIES